LVVDNNYLLILVLDNNYLLILKHKREWVSK
jgi:hypothetical protein